MKDIVKKLIVIQQTLNAPKDKRNSFGGYNYRSLEGILESIKPLLADQACAVFISDEVVEKGGRTFLNTTLTFTDGEDEIKVTATAEHEATKKGMDASQISGSASSYARKYAMNALFAIDDCKDADTNEYQQSATKAPKTPKAPKKMDAVALEDVNTNDMAELGKAVELAGEIDKEKMNAIYTQFKGRIAKLWGTQTAKTMWEYLMKVADQNDLVYSKEMKIFRNK